MSCNRDLHGIVFQLQQETVFKGCTLKVKINNMKFTAQVVQTWAVHIVWVET
jgi:hypothetical protein